MSLNAAIYDPATGTIVAFIRDAIRSGNSFRGTNGRYVVGSSHQAAVRWTKDDAEPVLDQATGMRLGWNPATVDQLTEAATDRDIGIVDRPDLLARLDHLRDMTKVTDAQIGNYIETNVTDMASTKAYLARLTKETRDVLRVALWALRGKL